ncbi:hypothetical protein ABEY48_14865 [Bacillus mycoides]|uniref:Uncharacterized protein n=1 Tax=Bacillus cereus TaxID=1396 RepID=A0A9X6B5Q3_BACCE|nr:MULTISPECIES: hypothetical protein [Bacillus cereus group]MBG9519143.1 phage protein [Bacillus thuringiensis]MDA1677514.1 hypothetical protein [Bacillus cereus group sp. TH152-1LC]MED3469599.1 hypothetical protein [Bacillus thuringiensis]OOR72459.1 hypothetical protein BLX06_24835 [Bacillus cereus]
MLNEELLEALIKYRRFNGKNPDILQVHPKYFRNLLEELNYPEWLIKKKEAETGTKKSLLGVAVELTDAVEKFKL